MKNITAKASFLFVILILSALSSMAILNSLADKNSEESIAEYNQNLNIQVQQFIKDNSIAPVHPYSLVTPDFFGDGGVFIVDSNDRMTLFLNYYDNNVSVELSFFELLNPVNSADLVYIAENNEEIVNKIKAALLLKAQEPER